MSVILFHAGVPGLSGGFVGVDVFFVISGYLITGILVRELDRGEFSLATFYERRLRRIMPALLFCCLGTLLIGSAILMPFQLPDLAKSVTATLAFASNIWFWRTTDYFGGDGASMPLLHTWSLGVEEQFYILFPFALWLFHRWGRLRLGIAAALMLSLLLSIALLEPMPTATFYLLPTRAWELMAGALLAVCPPIRSFKVPASVIGCALILVPVLFYHEGMPFPGLLAVPPVLGTVLLIGAGDHGPVRHILSSRVMTAIGLISYSLYLWHWPLLVFSKHLGFVSVHATIVVVALTFALAWISWRFVEQPFRGQGGLPLKRVLQVTVVTTGTVLALSACAATGLAWRLPATAQQLASGQQDRPPNFMGCPGGPSCGLGVSVPPTFILWGDSHAAALATSIDIEARRQGRGGQLYAFLGCPPSHPAYTAFLKGADIRTCETANRNTMQRIVEDPTVETVLMNANWDYYFQTAGGDRLSSDLRQTIVSMRQAGKRVIVIASVSPAPVDLPTSLALDSYLGRAVPTEYRASPTDRRLAEVARSAGATLLDLNSLICPQGRCPTTVRGTPIFSDAHHLSATANRHLIAPALQAWNGDGGLLLAPTKPR